MKGRKSWEAVTAEDIVSYQSTLGPPIAISTQLRRLSSLRSLLKFLKRHGSGEKIELPSLAGIRKPKRLPKALEFDVLVKLLQSPDMTTAAGMRDRALMELIYGAGLRVSEAVELSLAEFDLDQAAFRVTGKRGKTRWIPIPRHTTPWIE